MSELVVVPAEVPRDWLASLDEAGCEVIVGVDSVPEPRRHEVAGLFSLLTMRVDAARVSLLTHTLHYGVGAFEGIRAYRRASGEAFRKPRQVTASRSRCCGSTSPNGIERH